MHKNGCYNPDSPPLIRLQTSRSCSFTVESLPLQEGWPSPRKLRFWVIKHTSHCQLLESLNWNRQQALKALGGSIIPISPDFILFLTLCSGCCWKQGTSLTDIPVFLISSNQKCKQKMVFYSMFCFI